MASKQTQFTIANGQTASGVARTDQEGRAIWSITMPSAWTAADLALEGSIDGGTTWVPLVDSSGTALALTTPAVDSMYVLTDVPFVPHMRLVSSVAQGAERIINVQVEAM